MRFLVVLFIGLMSSQAYAIVCKNNHTPTAASCQHELDESVAKELLTVIAFGARTGGFGTLACEASLDNKHRLVCGEEVVSDGQPSDRLCGDNLLCLERGDRYTIEKVDKPVPGVSDYHRAHYVLWVNGKSKRGSFDFRRNNDKSTVPYIPATGCAHLVSEPTIPFIWADCLWKNDKK